MASTTRTAPAGAKPPAPQPAVAEQTTTISGYAISILAFIPVSKKDLARQIEVPTLLRDISEGRKTIADLAGYLHGTEMKMNFINKRYPVGEARSMMEPAAQPAEVQEPVTDKPTLEGEE